MKPLKFILILFFSLATALPTLARPALTPIQTTGSKAKVLWSAIDLMAKIEGIDIHILKPTADYLELDSISCVSESYNACSFFVNIKGVRKMIVHTDAALTFMQALIENGVQVNQEDNSRIGARHILCAKSNADFSCSIHPDEVLRRSR